MTPYFCVLCYAEKDTEPYQDRKFYYFTDRIVDRNGNEILDGNIKIICATCIRQTKEAVRAEWYILKEVED